MDHVLVRSHNETGYNLAVGEPFILQDALKQALDAVDPLVCMEYPQLGGEECLVSEIRKTTGDKYVVIANGAKQAISAALYAYKQLGKNDVYHRSPFWLSYPTLAGSAGLSFSDIFHYSSNPVYITTSPNNPDGEESVSTSHIWDAAYAHEIWGWSGQVPEHEVAVYSAAKLYGASGLRVGWLTTEREDLANFAAHYVEITTSGVCTMAQQHVAGVMRELDRYPALRANWYSQARRDLLLNGELFNTVLGKYCSVIKGVPATGKGMFAFFKPLDEDRFEKALNRSKVKLVPGIAFGKDYVSWYRMSMGHRTRITELACMQVAAELEKV